MAAHFYSPIVLGHQPNKMEESVADEVRNEERTKCWEKAYCVIRDFMLGVDHVPIYMSRCYEQLSYPLLPP